MFIYNCKLAWRSLGERPGLTALMVAAIAVGLGLYMTVRTMAYQAQKLPLGARSSAFYMTQLDNRETSDDELSNRFRLGGLTYRDAINLMAADTPATAQTLTWKTEGILSPMEGEQHPMRARGLVGLNNFFRLFDVPFQYGGSWDADADAGGDAVIVLSHQVNQYLFGGINSVGRQLKLNTHTMTVVGVLDRWQVQNRFYDGSFRSGSPDAIFIPHRFAINNNFSRQVRLRCWSTERSQRSAFYSNDIDGLMNSECRWIAHWAKLDTPAQVRDYRDFLEQYIDEQQALGRFPRENLSYATNIVELMKLLAGGQGSDRVFGLIATLFFAVCLINAIGILLAKFMRRTKEVSLRRALGAKKATIMQQHLVEVSMIGVMGGLGGIGLAWLGLQACCECGFTE